MCLDWVFKGSLYLSVDKILQMAQWQTQGHQSEHYYSNHMTENSAFINNGNSRDREKWWAYRFLFVCFLAVPSAFRSSQTRDSSHNNDNARPLTCWATRTLQTSHYFLKRNLNQAPNVCLQGGKNFISVKSGRDVSFLMLFQGDFPFLIKFRGLWGAQKMKHLVLLSNSSVQSTSFCSFFSSLLLPSLIRMLEPSQ